MTASITKKAGKGRTEGVVSELATYFHVKPGHEQEVAAACQRMCEALRQGDIAATIKTGLRDSRHVVFDNGTRLLWATTFETEWDPYIDDAFLTVGFEHFVDWMQHTTEWDTKIAPWIERSGGLEALTGDKTREGFEEHILANMAGMKQILQDGQQQAAAYVNPVGSLTMPEIAKAHQINAAFQEVLDNPAAEEALQHPALKPLLAQAAS
ncbi:hypothetical protein [Streptomyces mirabilis]|uniref:hypothetical protein n=1 Tax=Streptomyces mirabilis TaxID=68239 RepID=UPI0036905A0F